MPRVELVVPADAEYVGLVRMVVSAAAAGALGDVDDLLVAVSEACTLAVHSGASSMTIECTIDDSSVTVAVAGVGSGDVVRTEIDPFSLMRALVDDVSMENGTVRLVQRCDA